MRASGLRSLVLSSMLVLLGGCGADEPDLPEPQRPAPGLQYAQFRTTALRLQAEGDPRGALKQAARAINTGPWEREAYELISRLYVELGDDERAAEFFGLGTAHLPEIPYGWYFKGFHQYRLTRWPEALAAFERAAELAPDDPQPLFRQGLILQAMGDFDGALDRLRRAHEIDRQDPTIAARFSRALRISGNYEEAEDVVIAALQTTPESSDLHYALGQLRLREERDDEAERELREAIRLGPGRWDARFDLVRLLSRTGREPEALDTRLVAERVQDYGEGRNDLARLLAAPGPHPTVALVLAELELTENTPAQAERWLIRAEADGADVLRLNADRVELAVKRGDLAGARSLLMLIGATDPRSMLAAASYNLALGETAKGLGYLNSAVTHGPQERSFLRRAADLYAAAGRVEEARGLLLQASAAPEGPAAEARAGMAAGYGSP